MTIFQALVLGIVQGLTEFLPVSSSAHLVIIQYLFGLKGPALLVFDVVVHLGTLTALLIYFTNDFFPVPKIGVRMMGLILLATIPTAILGLFLKKVMEPFFTSLMPVAITLFVNSFILASTYWAPRRDQKEMHSPWDALWIGIVQGISVLPGISRSGSTVSAALWLKIKGEDAVRFSFFIAIPAIVGAAVLVLPKSASSFSSEMAVPMIVGFIAALISGLFAVSILFRVISKGKFHYFGFYTLIVSSIAFVFSIFH